MKIADPLCLGVLVLDWLSEVVLPEVFRRLESQHFRRDIALYFLQLVARQFNLHQDNLALLAAWVQTAHPEIHILCANILFVDDIILRLGPCLLLAWRNLVFDFLKVPDGVFYF